MTEKDLVLELMKAAHAKPGGPDWRASARRARELLGKTETECELIEAALAFDATNFYLHGQPETCSCVLCRLKKACAKVRAACPPQPRWIAWEFGIKDTHSGVVWQPLTFEANNGGGVSLRDATLAALNAQPPAACGP